MKTDDSYDNYGCVSVIAFVFALIVSVALVVL